MEGKNAETTKGKQNGSTRCSGEGKAASAASRVSLGDIAERHREKWVVTSLKEKGKRKGEVGAALVHGTRPETGQRMVTFLWWEEGGEENPR